MAGHVNGVSKQIQKTRHCKVIRDVLDLYMGISQVINWSPKQFLKFQQCQSDFGILRDGLQTSAMDSILSNYPVLLNVMEQINSEDHSEYGLKVGS